MLNKFKLQYFPAHQKNYGQLVELSTYDNGAQLLSQAAIKAIQEENINLVFCIFKYDLLYKKLLASPALLREIIVAIPSNYEYLVLDILSQRNFMQALLQTESAPAYIEDFAKTHPVIQKAIFDYLYYLPNNATLEDPIGQICKALFNSPYAAECICTLAILNRKFAEILFENYYTKENRHFIKMLELIAHSSYSIELLINIIRAHHIDCYIQRVSPQYTLDFCVVKIDVIYRMIFNAFTRAYLDHNSGPEQSVVAPNYSL